VAAGRRRIVGSARPVSHPIPESRNRIRGRGAAAGNARNAAWPRFGLEIVGKKPLLRAAWDGDAIVLVLFERGSWETQFLRLASAPRRNRRDTDRVADRIAGRLPQEP
jgi:hypothetical protein